MNSIEGFKGFTSFLLLIGIVGLSLLGISYLPSSNILVSNASDKTFEPINLKVNNITEKGAEITWDTKNPTLSIFFYSADETCLKDKLNTSSCPYKSEEKSSTNHNIVLESLESGTTYFYKIKSENYLYPADSTLSFSTQKAKAPAAAKTGPSTKAEDDSSGIAPAKDQANPRILGSHTSAADETKVDQSIINEFRNALLYQDMRLDFNKDGVVDIKDYPIYIEFVKNKED